ncbi:thiamine biosynthesis protein ThiF [Candidatus Pacearchaeota archaeon]|nr:thiamine biosynthesis protein ThiF [Candidatus Pacearchaeota archaeon]|tara:strand:+ start:2327 stop:2992 length:666 start_codon:yes stop_codon:yes gene_type:complete
METEQATSRFERQKDLIPQITDGATVIGVGAVGRQVALQLAAIGVPQLQIVDFDTVDLSNVTTQGYSASCVGVPKVDVLSHDINHLVGDVAVTAVQDRWRPRVRSHQAVFCCVDLISTRKIIWDDQKQFCQFWTDARMMGETIRVLAADNPAGFDAYDGSLFSQDEAQAGTCTSRSTIYAATIAAGLMVHQYTRWLRRVPLDHDATMNLLSGELTHGECDE